MNVFLLYNIKRMKLVSYNNDLHNYRHIRTDVKILIRPISMATDNIVRIR